MRIQKNMEAISFSEASVYNKLPADMIGEFAVIG